MSLSLGKIPSGCLSLCDNLSFSDTMKLGCRKLFVTGEKREPHRAGWLHKTRGREVRAQPCLHWPVLRTTVPSWTLQGPSSYQGVEKDTEARSSDVIKSLMSGTARQRLPPSDPLLPNSSFPASCPLCGFLISCPTLQR